MAGTPYWRESTPVISSSEIIPSFTSAAPNRPPFFFWCSRAWVSCSWFRSFSLTRISPSRADTLSLRYCGSGKVPCADRLLPPTAHTITQFRRILGTFPCPVKPACPPRRASPTPPAPPPPPPYPFH